MVHFMKRLNSAVGASSFPLDTTLDIHWRHLYPKALFSCSKCIALQNTVIETVSPRLQPRLPGQASPPAPASAPAVPSQSQEVPEENADDDYGSFEEADLPPQLTSQDVECVQETNGKSESPLSLPLPAPLL